MKSTGSWRVWVGALTSTIWISVGIYTAFVSPTTLWRVVGVAEIAVGVWRAWLWWRGFQRLGSKDDEF